MSLIQNNIWMKYGITLNRETNQKDRWVSILSTYHCLLSKGWLRFGTLPVVKLIEMRKHTAAAVLHMYWVVRPDSWQATPTLEEAQRCNAAPLDSYPWPHLDFQKSTYSDSLQACVNCSRCNETASRVATHQHSRAKRWTTHSLKCCIF